ncbi:MAG: DUF5995 family protein [Egibacteraceae bacterium]
MLRARLTIILPLVLLLTLTLAPVATAGPKGADGDYEKAALKVCPDGEVKCVAGVLRSLRKHTAPLARTCDHDAIFAALYTIVTRTYYETVSADPNFFKSNAFVNHEDGVFAFYYLGAYEAWQEGRKAQVPRAWRIAFAAAENQELTATGNLIMGINAHVVRDLPFVLAALGLGNKDDHNQVNEILWDAYAPAITAINDHLADSIDAGDIDGTTLDNEVLFAYVTKLREQAWYDATLLVHARTPTLRKRVAAQIEAKAAAQARSYREQYAYPNDSEAGVERNAYCEANSQPVDYL